MFTNRGSLAILVGGILLGMGALVMPASAAHPLRVLPARPPTVVPRPVQPINHGYHHHGWNRNPMPGRVWYRIDPGSSYNISDPYNPYSPYYQPWIDPYYPMPMPTPVPVPLPYPYAVLGQ